MKIIPTTGFERLTEAVTSEYGQLIELVRQAVANKARLVPGGGSDYYVDVRGIWPDHVVVGLRGRLFSYPYSLGADNTVTVSEGTEVVVNYEAVTAALREAQTVDQVVFREASDGSIEVTLIRAGKSGNANYYPDSTLREAVALFEGVRVFAKSDADHVAGKGKDVRNLIGGIYGVRFVEGKSADTGALVGTFKPLDPSDTAVTKMTEAVKRGMQGLLGLSIDAIAKTGKRTQGNQVLREAKKFTKVMSVDLIVEPGAGGGLDRLTEAVSDTAAEEQPSLNTTTQGTDMVLKQRLLEAIKLKDPAKFATIDAEKISDDDLVKLHEAVLAAPAPAAGTQRLAEAQEDNTPLTRADLAMFTLRQTAATRINASKLPAVAKTKLVGQFNTAERFTEAEIDNAIKAEGDYLGHFTESGSVRVPSFGNGDIQVGDRSVLIKDMLSAFFDPTHKDHRKVQSFRECYVQITGDHKVTGLVRDIDMGRMAESLGTFRESIGSATFSAALGDSITRRMQAIYIGMTDLDVWKEVATYGPVSDFRTQERARIGGYGNLPAVAQGGAYNALSSPGDDKATYAVTKRGGTEDVTLEAIKNDDVQALRRIPLELALAAKNTLYEFVFDFFRTNPTVYDGLALYHATHNNLFTAALSATEFAAHRLSMLKQTRAGSGKRLATDPRSILVPFELEETAFNLFVRNQNNDKTFVQTINPKVIPVAYWTDGNDWVTVGDIQKAPVIEIGFLDGQEEPELFVQDMPNVGSMFTNDKATYKIRHIYGGNVLVDGWKATTKGVVA